MSATAPTNQLWLRNLLAWKPHQIIGVDPADPYLLRWYVIPRNPRLNVYLHKFMRSDVDTLHDHPWWFLSVILRGGYIEHTESADRKMVLRCRTSLFDVRSPFWRRSIGFRPATHRHQVVLPSINGVEQPCWTLIVTGRNVRAWGFWCPTYKRGPFNVRDGERFVPWQKFTAAGSAGCGETA